MSDGLRAILGGNKYYPSDAEVDEWRALTLAAVAGCEMAARIGIHHDWRLQFPELWGAVQAALKLAAWQRSLTGRE